MTLTERLKSLSRLLEGGGMETRLPPRYPGVAVELTADRVTGVRVAAERKTGRLLLRQVEWRPLPEGAIRPSLTRPNIASPEPVTQAVKEILHALAPGEHRVSVLLPDHVARVALLGFTALPRTRRELADLVRFRMAKSLPYRSDEAALDLMLLGGGASAAGGPAAASVLAAFIHRAVLDQFEMLFLGAGYWPGLVGLSTFELFNLFRARIGGESADGRDALLMNATPRYLSILIFSGGQIIFYRCKPYAVNTAGQESLVGIRREIYTSLAFYQEKLLGRGIGHAFLRVVDLPRGSVREAVEGEVGCGVSWLDLAAVLSPAEGVTLDDEIASRASPAAGAAAGRRA